MKTSIEWLKKALHFIFKYTYVILENDDKTYKMNLYNPISYIVLFIVALIAGVWDGALSFWIMIKHTIRDSK